LRAWRAVEGVSKDKKIELTFAMKESNIDILEKRVLAMSTPTSGTYGKQMSLEEINQLTHPGNDAIKSVMGYLRAFSVEDVQYSSGFLRVTTTVSEAEKILSTKYVNYKHTVSGKSVFRCDSYSLPDEISNVVSFVAPTVNFPPKSIVASKSDTPRCTVDMPESILTPKAKATVVAFDDANMNTLITLEADGILFWQTLLSTSNVKLTLSKNLGNENVTFQNYMTVEMMAFGNNYELMLNGNIIDAGSSYSFVGHLLATVTCQSDSDVPVVAPASTCVATTSSSMLTPNSVGSISPLESQAGATYVYLKANDRVMFETLVSNSMVKATLYTTSGNDDVTLVSGLTVTYMAMGSIYQVFVNGTIIDNYTTYNIINKQIGVASCDYGTEQMVGATFRSTPDNLRALYGVANVQGTNNVANRQAFTGFLEQYYLDTDLQSFYDGYYPTLSGTSLYKVIGPNHSPAGVEASLDVQYLTALGSNVLTEFWSFAGRQPENPENEPFLDWLYLLGNTTDAPYVFSNSYAEDEGSVSLDYAQRMNDEFLKGSARGISFFFGSGDWGVGSAFGDCTDFTPMFPADSPYVTAVGATTGSNPEVAASLSGGGFSTRWAQPEWQTAAVAKYLGSASNLPDGTLYNSSGRALPDIAAQGTNFVVISGGRTMPTVAGTSASTPVVSGIVSLINEARIAAGKSPMGLLNPFIYQFGSSIFTDVTSGNNPGCDTKGFYAASQWDPVTGWGTINYDKMLAAALSLP
jgi:subtilase family serine protease